jgi:xanthine/CO dehydrogenase XdhC/CoxF family maturation factor
MATSSRIITALNEAADAGERVVLATVVRITGSSYGGVRCFIQGGNYSARRCHLV